MCAVRDDDNNECFIPGIVDHIKNQKYYVIKYFNGQNGINLISELVKMGREQYDWVVDYIVLKLGMKKFNIRNVPISAVSNIKVGPGKKTLIEMKHFNNLIKNETTAIIEENDDHRNLYFNNHYLLDLNTVGSDLMHLRMSLPDVDLGVDVVAKSKVDGFYYRHVVKQYCANRKYILRDSNGLECEVYRENIITRMDTDPYFEVYLLHVFVNLKFKFNEIIFR
jgi:hypothetical protein